MRLSELARQKLQNRPDLYENTFSSRVQSLHARRKGLVFDQYPGSFKTGAFLDLAQRAGMRGIQGWLSFYFKGLITAEGLYPEHDILIQLMKLKNALRWMQGEDPITHLGLEYYD